MLRSLFTRERAADFVLQPVHADGPQLEDAELAAIYYGQRMAGDFYEFLRVSPNRVLFALLDMAGHADQNRNIVDATQTTLRSEALTLFNRDDVNEADAMVELCLLLNRAILSEEGGVRACSAFAGCFNEDLGTVSYVNAGHTPGLLRHPTGITELGATGLPLGLFSHATCDSAMVALEPNSALLVVSRGMVEGKHRGSEFGMQRLKQSVQACKPQTARQICSGMLETVQKFTRNAMPDNDVTVMALLRKAATKSAASVD
ncbi:MAG TPA: SpoIIE family protein phosphatase [Terriglobales bacterium]